MEIVACASSAMYYSNVNHLSDAGAFTAGDTFLMGTVFRELAHMIDYVSWTPTGDAPSWVFPKGSTISEYASRPSPLQQLEYWAEAVTQWVYPNWKSKDSDYSALQPDQINWLSAMLQDWGFPR